jgi:hypothetical protein
MRALPPLGSGSRRTALSGRTTTTTWRDLRSAIPVHLWSDWQSRRSLLKFVGLPMA